MKRSILVVWMALLIALLGTTELKAATFEGLGDLAGGEVGSRVSGVSADGSVVVGWSRLELGHREAFRWTAQDGMVGLGALPGDEHQESVANAISADGSVVVGWSESDLWPRQAFRWTAEGGMVGLGDLPGGSGSSNAHDVSADGSVVVGNGSKTGFRWTADDGMEGIEGLPTGEGVEDGSYVTAISADGSVVVGGVSFGFFGTQPFRWTIDEGLTMLGNSDRGQAHDVSADGSIVVGYARFDQGEGAFLWTAEAGMVELGDLAGGEFSLTPQGISADGSVIVGEAHEVVTKDHIPFLWNATHGVRRLQEVLSVDYGLDLTGWELTRGADISADGRVIVGNATNPDGNREAWRVVIPEPSSGVLVINGLLVLLTCGLRKRGWFGPRV